MSKYISGWENDPHVQRMIASMGGTFSRALDLSPFDYDVTTAVIATALGNVLGELQVKLRKHAEECDGCRAGKMQLVDFYELAVKNFGSGFGHGKETVEQQHADGTAAADDLLDRIIREHKK